MSDDQSIVEMWRTVETMCARMGYDNIGFRWDGPIYKPENSYLTNEGWPLGSVCWYVLLEYKNLGRLIACAHTPQEAVRRAAAIVVMADANPQITRSDVRHLHLDPTAPWAKDAD